MFRSFEYLVHQLLRVIADLHIHSRYSRATSPRLNIREIAKFGTVKGLDIIGVGDFTHPKWFDEIKEELIEIDETGIFSPRSSSRPGTSFLLSVEVSVIFDYEGSTKKIHHVVLTPSFETASQINERLSRYGSLISDGRPTLNMTAPALVEEVMEVSSDNFIFPAHAWTPWFSLFGANSGFDRLDDCYQDMTKYVTALETGLSSDPPMNWRLSQLDRLTLLSNSDSHSHWPWRIGREANVFELKDITYKLIMEAIKAKDPTRFKFTIETHPAYGKYHWTGHRACEVSMSTEEAVKQGNICSKCGKRMAKGVEQRVEELADRDYGYKPGGAIDYIHLLPLSEILATTYGLNQPSTSKVWNTYNSLMEAFGNEYRVLLDIPREDIARVTDESVASNIEKFRLDAIKVVPGYDGVYGKIELASGDMTEV
jgi:uncharacterized protein (TIGR00375 family)